MIDMYSKYDNMHKNIIFYVLICINNYLTTGINYILSVLKDDSMVKMEFFPSLFEEIDSRNKM